MRTSIIAATLGLAVAVVPTAASAQNGWQSINQRQSNLYNRIDQGIRSGALTRPEASQLRTQFQQLNRLENRYRAGGLSNFERQDLNSRYDQLAAKVRFQKNDRQDRRGRR
jgi:hypothetical protein